MTLAAEAAKAAAAEKYKIASTISNEQYWSRRAAETAVDTGRDLIVAGAAVPAAAENSAVTISRPQVPAVPQTRRAENSAPAPSASAPLSAESVTAFLAEHRSYDAAGVTALEQKWAGPDMAANLGYARSWLSRHLSSEQQERIRAASFDVIPLYELIAQFGRDEAHGAPTTATTTTTKGPPPMSDESRPDALKRFRKLTSELHSARARMDHLRARELADERDQLSAALFPGDGSPSPDHSGHQVG